MNPHYLRAAQLGICEAQSLLKWFDGRDLQEITGADLKRVKARLKAVSAEISAALANVNEAAA